MTLGMKHLKLAGPVLEKRFRIAGDAALFEGRDVLSLGCTVSPAPLPRRHGHQSSSPTSRRISSRRPVHTKLDALSILPYPVYRACRG